MFDEDLDAFLDEDEHAVAAVYDPDGPATAVSVIFDHEFLRALGVLDTSSPVAIGKASVFPAASVSRGLVIGGVRYTIRSRQPLDDGALVALQLETA